MYVKVGKITRNQSSSKSNSKFKALYAPKGQHPGRLTGFCFLFFH